MARSFGLYLDGPGITDRATVIIDAGGVVRYAKSVGPGGQRDIAELAAECERVDKSHAGAVEDCREPSGLAKGGVLYVKSHCGFSRAALLARDNLHLAGCVAVSNVSEDAAARKALSDATGREQAPCLMVGGEAIQESADIVACFVKAAAPL